MTPFIPKCMPGSSGHAHASYSIVAAPTYYGTATTEATRKGRALRPHRMLSHPSDTTVVSVSLKQERSKTDSPMSINISPMAKHDAGTADAAQLVPNMDRRRKLGWRRHHLEYIAGAGNALGIQQKIGSCDESKTGYGAGQATDPGRARPCLDPGQQILILRSPPHALEPDRVYNPGGHVIL